MTTSAIKIVQCCHGFLMK